MLLEELKIDFAMKRGHEMIVDLKAGITRDQLDGIETQMLQGQRIPRLLKIQWIDIDGGVTFRYPLDGKRLLVHRLQTRQMTMVQFYALLLAVVEVLDDCRHYMLRSDCFLLHEQHIFIGENWDDIYLAYVPLRDMGMVSSAGEAVLAMAIRWVSAIENPDGTGLQQVFQHLRGELVSWERLRQTLLALLGASYRVGLPEAELGDSLLKLPSAPTDLQSSSELSAKVQGRHKVRDGSVVPVSVKEVQVKPLEEEDRNSALGGFKRNGMMRDEPVNLPLVDMTEEEHDSPSRKGWVIGAGWVLVVAVVWRFLYLGAPTRTNLLLCGGLTILTGAAALIGLRSARGRESSEELRRWNEGPDWSQDDGFVPNSIGLGEGRPRSLPGKRREAAADLEESREEKALKLIQSPPPVSKPAVLSQEANEMTVLLGGAAKEAHRKPKSLPWLERHVKGQAEKITLEQSQFIIGRSDEGVHFKDQSSGISRAHVELSDSEGSWYVKDMGSRNGSTLNGSSLIPYKAYSLTDTDQLQLAGEEGPIYIFRAG